MFIFCYNFESCKLNFKRCQEKILYEVDNSLQGSRTDCNSFSDNFLQKIFA